MVIGVLLTTVTLPADAQQRNNPLVRVDTLNDGRIVVSNPDSPPTGVQGTPGLVEVLRIGSLDGTCDAFGEVTSIAVDADGRIYVADRQANEIRVFSPTGECVRTFGRSGEGPGECAGLSPIIMQIPA
ncbi:MAG: 6-bladed beta-propeller [Gemmatimonadetes bacterium]|nr:6-bladed beta-propeller [Gemmatimonadota bacterium]MYG36392.1 6-bladed beta-propeller [Gemmatimonadota bacterium]